MTLVNKILILGAGQSAVYAASEIRKHDTDSIINIFNEENYLPYERPPLSKDFLLNEKKEDKFLFFSKDFYEEKRIELINSKIISVDFKNKLVFTNDNLKGLIIASTFFILLKVYKLLFLNFPLNSHNLL